MCAHSPVVGVGNAPQKHFSSTSDD
uniref:Uncharacterized protein n=2 Tax=gambiae species complex TaxID=44542 RepID=A0A182IEV6_ANOAR